MHNLKYIIRPFRLCRNKHSSSRSMATNRLVNKQGTETSLRHLKYQKKVLGSAGKLSVPGTIDVHVISTGYPGTPTSINVDMTYFKYLFNCGEGTQRIASEHGKRISRIQDIFITRKSWENISGLLGMCLSIEGVDVPSIRIHGPPNVEKLVTMSKGFSQLRKLHIEKQDLSQGHFVDSAMRIDYIPLLPANHSSVVAAEDDLVIAYLCQPHPKPRSVSLDKCVDLGIKPGPIIGKLVNGEEVTLPDGRLIKPDEILGDVEDNSPFLVLEVPTESYLESVLSNEQLSSLNVPANPAKIPQLIVHMTPPEILHNEKYITWIKSFAEKTTHIILNHKCSGLVHEGVYRIQHQLNLLHDGIFPELSLPQSQAVTGDLMPNVLYGETGLRYNIRSKQSGQIFRDQCITVDRDQCKQLALQQPGVSEALQTTRDNIQKHTITDARDYPEILFLGTGSAIPSKVRNVSAIWLNLSPKQSVLLDCGECTFGQLMRHYADKTDDMLQYLDVIFVSHLHADHHMGIISIAKERRRVLEARGQEVKPLVVVAPLRLQAFYRDIGTDLGLNFTHLLRIVPVFAFYSEENRAQITTNPPDYSDAYKEVLEMLDMKKVEMVRVFHAQLPHGIILTHNTGWKLVYSGDTMPCPNLVPPGMDCDVLIHEATMEDDLEEEAKNKKHCTTSQAIQVGLEMKAKFILLTHFSQRYAKVPLFNSNFSDRVGIAFDNMRVRLNELPLIPYLFPALKLMFAEEYADLELKKLKRSYNKDDNASATGDNIQKDKRNKKQKNRKSEQGS